MVSISPTPRPQPESFEQFNALFGSNAGATAVTLETDRLAKAEWTLRKLKRLNPGDFVVRTALGGVLLITGQREEALGELDAAYSLRGRHLVPAWCTLALANLVAGDYPRARALAAEIIDDDRCAMLEPAINNAAHIGFLSGDVDLLLKAGDAADRLGELNVASLVIRALGGPDFLPNLANHQRIVRSILGPTPRWVHVQFVDDGMEPILLAVHWLFDGTRRDARARERAVLEALWDHYDSLNLEPGHLASAYTLQLLPNPQPGCSDVQL